MASDRFDRTFVIRTWEDAKRLWNFLKQNAKAMADQGRFIEVRVYEWKPRATDQQHAVIWVINEQIAQAAWVAGRRFDAETWHEQLKRELLPEETRKGVPKWRVLPSGERELYMSTTNLDREEKSEYIDRQIAYAADLGVQIQIEDRHRR
jgi:hypothetical protein